jgi:hypothetical protein
LITWIAPGKVPTRATPPPPLAFGCGAVWPAEFPVTVAFSSVTADVWLMTTL